MKIHTLHLVVLFAQASGNAETVYAGSSGADAEKAYADASKGKYPETTVVQWFRNPAHPTKASRVMATIEEPAKPETPAPIPPANDAAKKDTESLDVTATADTEDLGL